MTAEARRRNNWTLVSSILWYQSKRREERGGQRQLIGVFCQCFGFDLESDAIKAIKPEAVKQNNQTMVLAIPSYLSARPEKWGRKMIRAWKTDRAPQRIRRLGRGR